MLQLPRVGVEAPRLFHGASPDCIIVVVAVVAVVSDDG